MRNRSEQFEARLCLVEVPESPSILLTGMQGARLPIAVAHGEGRAEFATGDPRAVLTAGLVALRFVDGHGRRRQPLSRESERVAGGHHRRSRPRTAA